MLSRTSTGSASQSTTPRNNRRTFFAAEEDGEVEDEGYDTADDASSTAHPLVPQLMLSAVTSAAASTQHTPHSVAHTAASTTATATPSAQHHRNLVLQSRIATLSSANSADWKYLRSGEFSALSLPGCNTPLQLARKFRQFQNCPGAD
jgi:hypothetical protein